MTSVDPAMSPGPAPRTDAGTLRAFAPTLREVMLRPWWLGMLGLALLVAAIFAWLGQWQLSNAIDTDPPPPGQTEQIRPIAEVTAPGEYLPEPLVGQRVVLDGSFVADDFVVVSSRFDRGVEGFWVVGQFRLDPASAASEQPTSLAVAVGWTADRAEAEAAASALDADPPQNATITGRIISDESPAVARGADPQEMSRVASAALLSTWHDIEGLDVYRGYLTTADAFGGLTAIHSPAPDERSGVNWLNIFYAIEWAVFAGFAFYMWYRLAKDAWEKELEELEDLEELDATAPDGPADARD